MVIFESVVREIVGWLRVELRCPARFSAIQQCFPHSPSVVAFRRTGSEAIGKMTPSHSRTGSLDRLLRENPANRLSDILRRWTHFVARNVVVLSPSLCAQHTDRSVHKHQHPHRPNRLVRYPKQKTFGAGSVSVGVHNRGRRPPEASKKPLPINREIRVNG